MKILVMSCDKNQDLWYPYYHCMEKYGPDHPEIFYCTENFNNPYYKTIKSTKSGTKRVIDSVKKIEDTHILVMVDDIFLREKVNTEYVLQLQSYLNSNFAALNFEPAFDENDKVVNDFIKMRSSYGKYKTSCMCQLGQKKHLLDVFNVDMDPGTFERRNAYKGYKYLISAKGDFLNGGKQKGVYYGGLVQGKGTRECEDFFNKEGIKIDYSIRGFIDKE